MKIPRRKSFDEYIIPPPHACFLGKKVKHHENPDGEGIDFEVILWFTGGYRKGDKNIEDDNKYIHELVLHIKRADIIIWKTTTLKSIVLPACMVNSSCVQWSDNTFSIFAWHDAQLRNISNTLLELTFASDDKGKVKWEKEIIKATESQVLHPEARFCHTFTRFEGATKALLFGGNTLPNYGIPKLIVTKPFQATPAQSSIFLYMKDTNLWTVPVSEDDSFPTALAWHAATSFIDEHENESCILINGGIEFDQEKDTWRGFGTV